MDVICHTYSEYTDKNIRVHVHIVVEFTNHNNKVTFVMVHNVCDDKLLFADWIFEWTN